MPLFTVLQNLFEVLDTFPYKAYGTCVMKYVKDEM